MGSVLVVVLDVFVEHPAEMATTVKQRVGCQNSITPLTLEFAGACRSSRCEF